MSFKYYFRCPLSPKIVYPIFPYHELGIFISLGSELKELRFTLQLTLREMAGKIDIAPSTLSGHEHGRYAPRFTVASKLISSFPELKRHLGVPTKEEIKNLYWEKRLPLHKIAARYGISPSCVLNWMRQLQLSRRSLSEARMRYPKTTFNGDLTEKAYLLGLRTGDIYVYRDWNQVSASVATTHLSMIKLFKNIFCSYGRVGKIPIVARGVCMWRLYALLNNSFEFLVKKPKKIPPWIMRNKSLFLSFLAGYSDAEGCFCICPNKNRMSRTTIDFSYQLSTGDTEILRQIYQGLKKFGFSPSFVLVQKRGSKGTYGVLSKDIFRISITRRKEVILFIDEIYPFIKHSEKMRWIKLMSDLRDEKYWSDIEDRVLSLRNQIKDEVQKCIISAEEECNSKVVY